MVKYKRTPAYISYIRTSALSLTLFVTAPLLAHDQDVCKVVSDSVCVSQHSVESPVGRKSKKRAPSFLSREEVANSIMLLPEPPAEGSAAYEYDVARYKWGKTMRDTERGRLAVRDADTGGNWQGRAFSEAFGMPINVENTPEIYKLLRRVHRDLGSYSTGHAKVHYMRRRPFMVFEEPTATPDDEKFLRTNGSYPSGHTALGWGTALILAEINPERQNEILKRGYDFGESRVIVGAHWQSDVDMGRIVSAAAVARLHADEEFAEQLARAKAEFAAKIAEKSKFDILNEVPGQNGNSGSIDVNRNKTIDNQ